MDKEIIDEQMSAMKKGYDYTILPPELRYSKEEAEELLDFLETRTSASSPTPASSTPTPILLMHLSARSTRSCRSVRATRSV